MSFNHVSKSNEVLLPKDLGEEVCGVVFCVDMNGAQNTLVTKSLHPLLPHVDVLDIGLVSCVIDKDLGSGVVHLQLDRLWERDSHLICGVRKRQNIVSRICRCIDLCSS